VAPPPVRRVLFAPRDLPPLGPDVAGDLPRYRQWQPAREADRLARRAGPVPGALAIALLMVMAQPDPAALARSCRSLGRQTSDRWQLALALVGDLGPAAETVATAELGPLLAGQVVVARCPAGTSQAAALTAAFDRCTAPAVALLGVGDRLAPDAVALLAGALVDADVAYGDEDLTDADDNDDGGALRQPALKPDWSPELLLSTPYLGRPLAVRRELVATAGGVADPRSADWEHDLMLRVTEKASGVAHVAEVLCHRTDGPTNGGDDPTAEGHSRPVAAALARRGETGSVEPGPVPGSWRVRRQPATRPSVSAVIPFRDGARFLRTCVDSVTATTAGVDLQLVLVDNGSVEPETHSLLDQLATRPDVVVVHDDRPFNWAALNNVAAEVAGGEVLLFLNNDIEARNPGWLDALVAQAVRPDVGAAGARLLYPTGQVQHAGLVVGLGGAAGHVLAGLPASAGGYLGMAVLTRDCTAVTGACLATRRSVFDRLDGFDVSLGVDLNDIDYCLRARQSGLRIVYEPDAELVHYESPSRGTSGSVGDIGRFIRRWEGIIAAGDPFLNRHLTRLNSSCALRGPDEEGWWQAWRSTLGTS